MGPFLNNSKKKQVETCSLSSAWTASAWLDVFASDFSLKMSIQSRDLQKLNILCRYIYIYPRGQEPLFKCTQA